MADYSPVVDDSSDPSTEQAPPTVTADWIALARDAFTSSSTYFDASIRPQVEADLRQAQGQHPTGSKYLVERGRSKLFRPKTKGVIRKNEAAAAEAFFSTNDVVKLSAQDDNDPVQLASAAVMSELVQYRLTKSIPWFQIIIGAYQDAQTVGVVASCQEWLYNARRKIDKPNVRLIPLENLRFDPGADWTDPVGTSPYLIELIPMYVAEVKSRMRNPDPRTGQPRWKAYDDGQIMTATKNYGDTIRQQREGQSRTDAKAQAQANNNYSVVWVHKNIISVDDQDYVYYTLGCELLLTDPVPLEQVVFHGKRNYTIGCCIIETHKNYPASVPKLTKDIQAEINEVANQRIDNVKLAMNKRYFARRNKQVDLRSVTRNVPGSVTLVNDIDDVKVVEFNDVTGSSYKEQEVLNLDFDDVAGSFSGASVQSNRKLNETVGGMKLLNTSANQVAGYQLRTFVETWVEPVLRQLVLLEQYYETDETILGLCGQQAQIVEKFGIDSVTDEMLMQEFTLNVNVGMGATNPQEQLQQFVQGMTSLRDLLADGSLVKLGLKVDEVIKELFGKLGYKDGTRFFDMQNSDPRVAQLQSQIEQLQQALAAKHPPELLDAMVRQIDAQIASLGVKDKVANADAVKKGSEAQFSAMQTAEVIAAVPAVAPIADELMRAAGYTQPTPAGVDPNFPQPGMADPALAIEAVKNRRTGVAFMPGDASTTLYPDTAMPASPGTGVRQGIETVRPDSVGTGAIARQAMADGGLVDDAGWPLMPPPPRPLYPVQPPPPLVRMRPTGSADARDILARGGAFTNMRGEEDNLSYYNLAPMGLAPNAINNSPLRDMMSSTMVGNEMDKGPLAQLMSESAFNRRADGGLITGPGTGTSDSIPAQANGVPMAVSDGEYLIPAQVVQIIGQDFFEELIARYHQPVDAAPGAMPEGEPLPLENGDFVIPADVVAALGADFFDALISQYGSGQ